MVVDNFVTSTPRNLERHRGDGDLRLLRMDIRDTPAGRYDLVYHLASPASPVDYGNLPIETLMTNALGTQRVLEIARRSRARFLLASTSEVYGDPVQHPQRETYWGNVDPIGPRSAYDEGKRFAEALTVGYGRHHSMDVRIARIFNAYGPRMRIEDGRMPSTFIANALRGHPLPVYGTGRQTRSLCYVRDTAHGLISVMQKGRAGAVYNIGRPDEYSVLEFARIVLRLTGSTARIRFVHGRSQEIQRRKPDIRKASRELGWRPTTSLMDGLRDTIAWFEDELSRRGL